MKDTDTLISLLSHVDAAPRPPLRFAAFFGLWLTGCCAYIALLLLVCFKPRPDLAAKLMQPLFLSEIVSLVLLMVTTSLSAALLSFPDFYQKKYALYAPLPAFGLFAFALAMEWSADHPPAPQPAHAMECCMAITVAALPLAAWMFMRIGRMAPVRPALAGGAALLASFSIGALGLRLSEATDSIDHLIIWHYLPMLAFGVIGLGLGRRFLKW